MLPYSSNHSPCRTRRRKKFPNLVNSQPGRPHQILLIFEFVGDIPEDLQYHINFCEVDKSLGASNEMTADETKYKMISIINVFTAYLWYKKDNQPIKLIGGEEKVETFLY